MKKAFLLQLTVLLLLLSFALGDGQDDEEASSSTVATTDAFVEENEVVDLDDNEPTTTTTTTTTETPTQHDDEAIVDDAILLTEETSKRVDPVQTGPLIDLFGPTLLSLEMMDAGTARFKEHYTNEILRGKKVIGVYFSADWCGPCRQFTPELVNFYKKMNNRRGRQDEFQIVWVSRCRDVQSYAQYFTQMPWIALPPQEAMGARGERLSKLYKVKSIPTLILLDDMGSIITTNARNQIPKDKAGVGFPWRNPLVTLYMTITPKTLRFIIKQQLGNTVRRLKKLILGGAFTGRNKRTTAVAAK